MKKKKKKKIACFIACILLILTIAKPIVAANTEVEVVSSYSEFVKANEVKRDGTTQYMIVYKSGGYYYALRNSGGSIGTMHISNFVMSDGTLRVKDKDLYSFVYKPVIGTESYGYMKSLDNDKVLKIDKSTGLMTADEDTSSWSIQMKISKTENGYTIQSRNTTDYRYLKFNTSNNKFVAGTGEDETASSMYNEFMIYELVYETPEQIEPSESIRTSYNVDGDLYKAYSDKGTSDIEMNISTVPGKVDVDKSVSYNKDVYESGYIYSEGEFSVVLSALSDQYVKIKNPVPYLDVVFILDISGSMQFYGRMSKTVDALNESIAEIMAVNSNNRVGIATFSSVRNDGSGGNNGVHGSEFLPLASYDEVTLSFTGNDNLDDGDSAKAGCVISVEGVDNGVSTNNQMNVYGATYTQYGIYQAYEMLRTTANRSGRIPLVILLTDGEPTVYTESYDDVGNASTVVGELGNGHSYTSGEHGYYTILSACYYKDKIAELYSVGGASYTHDDVRFYNIGIDLENNTGNTSCEHFRNMIVNPNWATLQSDINCKKPAKHTFYDELKPLLVNNSGTWYEYCDKYENMHYLTLREDMEAFVKGIVADETSIIVNPLEAGTYLTFTDNLGVGMELKEAPIIRYDGFNYSASGETTNGNETVYTYSANVNPSGKTTGEKVNLSLMEVKVISNDDGTSTVVWKIPEALVPLLLRTSENEILYSILPMRLILKVGTNDVGDNKLTQGIPVYTNNWDKGMETNVTFSPATANGYYGNNYSATAPKDEMVSKTATTYYQASNSEGQVTALLGNNGKIVNLSKYTLPEAGGTQARNYYYVGCVIILAAVVMCIKKKHSKSIIGGR